MVKRISMIIVTSDLNANLNFVIMIQNFALCHRITISHAQKIKIALTQIAALMGFAHLMILVVKAEKK
jgi:hypothetical protein